MKINSIQASLNFKSAFTKPVLKEGFGKGIGKELSDGFNRNRYVSRGKKCYSNEISETADFYGCPAKQETISTSRHDNNKEVRTADYLHAVMNPDGFSYAMRKTPSLVNSSATFPLVAIRFREGDGLLRLIEDRRGDIPIYRHYDAEGKDTKRTYYHNEILRATNGFSQSQAQQMQEALDKCKREY